MKYAFYKTLGINKILYSPFLVFLLTLNPSQSYALSCSFDPYSAIKNVKEDTKTAVFIGKINSIEETTGSEEGIIASFQPYIQWFGQYNTLHDTIRKDISDSQIKVLIRKIPPWDSFALKENPKNNDVQKELPFFPKLNETYFIIARKDENNKHHYIDSHCHGSFKIDYSFLKMIDRFYLLSEPIANKYNEKINPDKTFPSKISLPPQYECPKTNTEESFRLATDVFEGTLVKLDHAYSIKNYPAENIPDFKEINPEYDYFNIAEYDFIVHRSWKGGYIHSLADNFRNRDNLPVGMRKVYTFNEDKWCGMFNNDTGCGVKLKEGERYIIYSDNSHIHGKSSHYLLDMINNIDFKNEPYSAITKFSRIIKGDKIKREIQNLQEPLYEINYKKNSY